MLKKILQEVYLYIIFFKLLFKLIFAFALRFLRFGRFDFLKKFKIIINSKMGKEDTEIVELWNKIYEKLG